ncbi:MAG: DedA family protein [Alphaproteobacteria bacterium]|nr:DedA family protein [Alphaproteobacteria bacterium]
MITTIIDAIVQFVEDLGYVGIFIMTFIESSFLPIPAEITMIPAGYLVSQGVMNAWIVMVAATAGSIGGASLNYWIALRFGRNLLLKYRKFFFITEAKLLKMEAFFEEHGNISTFTGRLLPGVRHFISFPAGLARMNIARFAFYTGLGGGLWMGALLVVGYVLGENSETAKQFVLLLAGKFIIGAALLVGAYVLYHKYKQRRKLEKLVREALAKEDAVVNEEEALKRTTSLSQKPDGDVNTPPPPPPPLP